MHIVEYADKRICNYENSGRLSRKCLARITRKRHEEKLPIRVVSIYVCVEHVKVVSWDFGDVPRLVRYIEVLRSVVEPNVYYTPL